MQEIVDLRDGVGVAERQHGALMNMLLKCLVDVAAYTMGGGVGVVEFGMLMFELLKLLHHHVEVAIRYFGGVQHVVIIIVSVKFLAQVFDLLGCIHL